MRRRPVTITVLATLSGLVVALTGCSSSDPAGTADNAATTSAAAPAPAAEPRHLVAKDFADAIKQAGVVILDVRTPAEFATGHITNAKNTDVQASTFGQQIAGLDKTATYALYCRSGHRSTTAGGIMLAAGFTKVVDLTGGITAWTAAGNQVTAS